MSRSTTTRRSAASSIRSCSAPSSCSLVYGATCNAIENLRRAQIASGFGFWDNTAGFDISQTLIDYSAQASTYGRAFWVGLAQHAAGRGARHRVRDHSRLHSSALRGCRRTGCWRNVATGYVETIRNIPLLLQLLFWYNAVLKALPEMRDSIAIPGGSFPQQSRPVPAAAGLPAMASARSWPRWSSASIGIDRVLYLGAQAGRSAPASRRRCSGSTLGAGRRAAARRAGAGGISAQRSTIRRPAASTSAAASRCCRNSSRCCSASSIYTAAFIAEVVRAGILAVSRGQTEAAYSLGLRPRPDACG